MNGHLDNPAWRDAIMAWRQERDGRLLTSNGSVKRAPGLRQIDGAEHTMLPPTGPAVPQRTSRFFQASELSGHLVPTRGWLVPELIPHGTVTLLSGDGGTGKSLLALQLAVAIAAEARWIGLEVTPGGVVFVSAEDDQEELHRRLADILEHTGGDFRSLERLTIRSLAGEDALLAVETVLGLAATTLYAEIESVVASQRDVRLIVLDTLADLYPANENDRGKVRQFIGLLRGLAIRQNCAVVLLGHPSQAGLASGSGSSGSTAWNNSVRGRLYFERIKSDDYESNPNTRRLRTMKSNYSQIGGEICLTWQRGVFVADEPTSGLDRMAANAKAERVFLRLFEEFKSQGRRVNPTSGSNYAPGVFAGHPLSEGITKRAFASAMEALLANNTLAVETDGTPSRRVSFLVRRQP